MAQLLIICFIFTCAVFHASAASVPKGLVPSYKYDGRIIGGYKITIDEVPYMAQIIHYGALICGGSIISEDVILTAAHCLKEAIERMLKIRVGSTYRTSGPLLRIRKILAHEEFVIEWEGRDVALIWLETPLQFSYTVQKIPLPQQDSSVDAGSLGLVTGWGYVNYKGLMPDHLMALQVPIVDRYVCFQNFGGYINEDMICAGYLEGGKDACSGDSGGPLVVDSRLVGITSFGNLCALPDYPGVYTNVAQFVDWIQGKITEELENTTENPTLS